MPCGPRNLDPVRQCTAVDKSHLLFHSRLIAHDLAGKTPRMVTWLCPGPRSWIEKPLPANQFFTGFGNRKWNVGVTARRHHDRATDSLSPIGTFKMPLKHARLLQILLQVHALRLRHEQHAGLLQQWLLPVRCNVSARRQFDMVQTAVACRMTRVSPPELERGCRWVPGIEQSHPGTALLQLQCRPAAQCTGTDDGNARTLLQAAVGCAVARISVITCSAGSPPAQTAPSQPAMAVTAASATDDAASQHVLRQFWQFMLHGN